MLVPENKRVFPESAGIWQRGFGTRVTGRLDDSNSVVFAELLQAWYCHFKGNPNAVLPYFNRKTLDLSNPDHRRRVSSEWWKACATEPSDGFVGKIVRPVEQYTHDVIHLICGLPTTWMGEHRVHYTQPLIGSQLGYGMRGHPFSNEAVKTQLNFSRSKFSKSIGFDKMVESWHARALPGREGALGAYFTAMMIGAANIRNDKHVSREIRRERWRFHANITDDLLQVTTAAQWRYAGVLTSLVEMNRGGGNPVDVTKPWNLVALRVPLDVLRDRMRGAFPVRAEDRQAVKEWKDAFGEEAEGVSLIDPRLLCFPPNLRDRVMAFEEEYGDRPAPRGDYLSPDISLFPSITPYLDQRDGANEMIRTMIPAYDHWARLRRGEVEPWRLEKWAARARQAAARPSQERPAVDTADVDIGAILLKQFTRLVTR